MQFSIALDPLSAVMLSTVTFVATWIAVFSAGYMHGRLGVRPLLRGDGPVRFRHVLLVLANNFFLLRRRLGRGRPL